MTSVFTTRTYQKIICSYLLQKENVSPNNGAKAVKVAFQSHLWDPQRHRILSPSMNSKLETCFTLDDTIGLENSPPNLDPEREPTVH